MHDAAAVLAALHAVAVVRGLVVAFAVAAASPREDGRAVSFFVACSKHEDTEMPLSPIAVCGAAPAMSVARSYSAGNKWHSSLLAASTLGIAPPV